MPFKKINELYKYRELLITLILREIKVRYKQTILGSLWAVVQPLSLMVIFTIIFSFFLKIESQGIPYPIFSYSALLPWTFFATSLTFGSASILNNGSLVTKVYFPREILPFSSIGAAFLDFLVASVIFVGLLVYYKINITLNILYLIPLIFILLIFTCSTVLFCASLVVLWRDLKFVVPLIVQLWMFATPVIYPVSKVPEKFRFIYSLNPMGTIIDNFRTVSVLGKSPNLKELLLTAIISLILFWLSYNYFKMQEKFFADII